MSPIFIQRPPILLGAATAPLIRSSAHKGAVHHFEKHWVTVDHVLLNGYQTSGPYHICDLLTTTFTVGR